MGYINAAYRRGRKSSAPKNTAIIQPGSLSVSTVCLLSGTPAYSTVFCVLVLVKVSELLGQGQLLFCTFCNPFIYLC